VIPVNPTNRDGTTSNRWGVNIQNGIQEDGGRVTFAPAILPNVRSFAFHNENIGRMTRSVRQSCKLVQQSFYLSWEGISQADPPKTRQIALRLNFLTGLPQHEIWR
jgi:hypothetical protein